MFPEQDGGDLIQALKQTPLLVDMVPRKNVAPSGEVTFIIDSPVSNPDDLPPLPALPKPEKPKAPEQPQPDDGAQDGGDAVTEDGLEDDGANDGLTPPPPPPLPPLPGNP